MLHRDRENIFPLFFLLYFLLFFLFFPPHRNKNLRFRPVPDRVGWEPISRPGSNRLCPGGCTANINFQIVWNAGRSKPFPNRFQTTKRTSLARIVTGRIPPRTFPFQGGRIDYNWESRATALFRFALLALGGNIFSRSARKFAFFSAVFFYLFLFCSSSNIIVEEAQEKVRGKIHWFVEENGVNLDTSLEWNRNNLERYIKKKGRESNHVLR